MKRVVFVVAGVLLVMVVLLAGCTKTTPAPAPTQTVTGNLPGVNPPAQPGPDVVTIQTPQGPQSSRLRLIPHIILEARLVPLIKLLDWIWRSSHIIALSYTAWIILAVR